MGVNQYKPHVLVLPEDDANSSLANGFHLELGQIRQMQVLEVAGGWNEVLTLFESVHAAEMDRCRHRRNLELQGPPTQRKRTRPLT